MVHAPGGARCQAELRSAVRVIELAAMVDRVITGGHGGSADGAGTRARAAAKVVPVPVQELGRTGWDAPPPAAVAPWIGFLRRHGLVGVLVPVRARSPVESRKVHPVRSTINGREGSSPAPSSICSSAGTVARSTSPMTQTTGVPSSSCSVATANLWPAPAMPRRASGFGQFKVSSAGVPPEWAEEPALRGGELVRTAIPTSCDRVTSGRRARAGLHSTGRWGRQSQHQRAGVPARASVPLPERPELGIGSLRRAGSRRPTAAVGHEPGQERRRSCQIRASTRHHKPCSPARQLDGTRPCLRGLSKLCQAVNAAAHSCGWCRWLRRKTGTARILARRPLLHIGEAP